MTNTFRVAELLRRATDNVPPSVLRNAKLHFLDALGVALAAAESGPISGITSLAQESPGSCTVLGTNFSAGAAQAALVNGSLMHSLEYDDTHTGSVVHGSSVLAAVALAVAERTGAKGDDLFRSFAVAWEFFIRIGLASPGGLQTNGFQVTAAGGGFAAAALAGLMSGDSPGTVANAIGIAGSQAAGTFAFLAEGNTVKAVQAGLAAHAGVLARDLAHSGVTGPSGVFSGTYGFYKLYAHDEDGGDRLLSLAESLGEEWFLPDAAFKALPCCHYLHPYVELAQQLVESGLGGKDIASIHCPVPQEVIPIIAEPWSERQHPRTAQDARWSLPYAMAWVLQYKQLDGSAFVGKVDPAVATIATKITYEPWPNSGFPDRFPGACEVTLIDGKSFRLEVADVLGGKTRPMSEQMIVTKAKKNMAHSTLPVEVQEEIVAEVLRDGCDVARLTALLRGCGVLPAVGGAR